MKLLASLLLLLNVIQIKSLKSPCKLDGSFKFDVNTTYAFSPSITKTSKFMNTNNIAFMVKTTKSRGMVLSMVGNTAKESDYIMIALKEGSIEVAYDLGASRSNPFTIRSKQRVDDESRHVVRVIRDKNSGRLIVDGTVVSFEFSSKYYQLNTDGVVHLGKIENIPAALPNDYKIGFQGHIYNITMRDVGLSDKMNNDSQIKTCE
ncbi:Uncharacterised protein g7473 [Pycnogonum litorale]